MLSIYENLLLLSIHEAKGTFIGYAADRLKLGLGGAMLAELALMGKIQATNNHRLQVINDSRTDMDVLDDVLAILRETEKERKFGYWINALNQKSDKFHRQIADCLVQKSIVIHEDDRLLWISPSSPDLKIKASPKHLLIQRLRDIAFTSEDLQPRDIALLSLVRACGVLDLLFLRDERKLASRSINELMVGQAVKDPAFQTIQEIETIIADMVEED